jgi:hypothetical protein
MPRGLWSCGVWSITFILPHLYGIYDTLFENIIDGFLTFYLYILLLSKPSTVREYKQRYIEYKPYMVSFVTLQAVEGFFDNSPSTLLILHRLLKLYV